MASYKFKQEAFRIILVAKYMVSVFHEKAIENERQQGSQNDAKIELGALRGLNFEFLGVSLRGLLSINNNSTKNRNVETETRKERLCGKGRRQRGV